MPQPREVSFELERFEWAGDDRLDVIGRWQGLRGRRLAQPTLTIQAGDASRRLTALPGGQLGGTAGERWKASFAWEGERPEITGADLEVGRSIVVELPPPRRRRGQRATPPVESALREELAELRAMVAELRTERAAASDGEPDEPEPAVPPGDDERAELAELREEQARLVAEHGELADQHARLRAHTGELRSELDDAHAAEERVSAELREQREQREQHAAGETERERLADELTQVRAALQAREEELAQARAAAQAASDDVERRVGEERAVSVDVREKLATAREEAQRAMGAEAEETEHLRAELAAAREEAERAVATERAETARLREELAARPAAREPDGGAEDDADEPARRMYERVSRELERERAAARTLRRELDSVRAEGAEQRRSVSSAAANGIVTTEEAPLAATVAGRQRVAAAAAVRASRLASGEGAPARRAEAMRHVAAGRLPEAQPAGTGVWVARAAAVLLVALLLIALLLIVSAVA